MTKVAARIFLAVSYVANFKNARRLEKRRATPLETSPRKSRIKDDVTGRLKNIANACSWLDE